MRFPAPTGKIGFTLIEVILAVGIFALVLVAINTAFFASMRLRQRTSEVLEEKLPLAHALSVLRRDLQNALPPGGVLAGNFRSEGPVTTSGAVSGSGTAGAKGAPSTVMGGQNTGLDFFTSTGHLSDDQPWADTQEVNYQLMESTNHNAVYGKDLVRSVTRNLLATPSQMADVQRLAANIESLEFAYYDGTQWQDAWDTSTGLTGLPTAVRVRVQPASREGPTLRSVQPLEMIVVLGYAGVTNQTQNVGGTP